MEEESNLARAALSVLTVLCVVRTVTLISCDELKAALLS